MRNALLFSRWRKTLSGTLAFLVVSPILSPYANAFVADGAPENVLSGPNGGYVSLANSWSYAPQFALSGSLDMGNEVVVEALSGSTAVASGSYLSASGGESSGSVSAIDFSSLSDGPYSLSGSVFSWSTATASGMTGSVVKDTVPPVFASTGSVSTGTGSATFTGISITDANFASASLSYSGTSNSSQTGTVSLSGSSSNLGASLTGLNPGSTYSFSLSATDLAGNSAMVTAGMFATSPVVTDTVPPVVTIVSHTNGQKVVGASVFLTWSATDPGTVVNVTVNSSPATLSGQTWSKMVSGLVSGTNPMTVSATDDSGNTGTWSVNVVRVPAAPTGQFVVVTGLTQATVSFETDVSATGTVLYGTSSGALVSSADDAGSSVSHSVPLSGLAPSTTYYYRTFGTAMGNSGSTSSVSAFRTASPIDVNSASGAVSVAGAAYFGNSTSTGATFANSGTITITAQNGTDSVSFPFGGPTLVSSGSWDSVFQAPVLTSGTANGAGTWYVFIGSPYQIGSVASELALTGSKTATVTLRVGTQYAGQTLRIYRSADGGETYALLTSCSVTSAGDCAFQSANFSLFAVAAIPDVVPDAFSFPTVTNANLSTLTESPAVVISWINVPVDVNVSGGEYSVNGGTYSSASWTVNNGDSIRMRLVSSASFRTAVTATVTVGSGSESFQVITKDDTGVFHGGGGGGTTTTPPVTPPPAPSDSIVSPGWPTPTGSPPPIVLDVNDLLFVDIANSWARPYIEKLAVREIVNNVRYYHPDYALTRAEFLKMVGNSAGWRTASASTPYDDVPENAWYAPYVSYALSNGIISNADNFRPNDTVTRAEVAKILIGVLWKRPSETNFSSFVDVNRTHTLFSYVEAARENGIFDGQIVDDVRIFRPNDPISRAEVAKVLVRTMGF